MTMMPPQAADDVSAGAEMMLLVSLAMMRCLPSCARRHTSLPQASSCAKHASFARQGKHHSTNKKHLSAFFIMKEHAKVPQDIERMPKRHRSDHHGKRGFTEVSKRLSYTAFHYAFYKLPSFRLLYSQSVS